MQIEKRMKLFPERKSIAEQKRENEREARRKLLRQQGIKYRSGGGKRSAYSDRAARRQERQKLADAKHKVWEYRYKSLAPEERNPHEKLEDYIQRKQRAKKEHKRELSQWAHKGKIGAGKLILDLRKIAQSKTSRRIQQGMEFVDDHLYFEDMGATQDNILSIGMAAVTWGGLEIEASTAAKMAFLAAQGVHYNHSALNLRDQIAAFDQKAEKLGAYAYLEKMQEQERMRQELGFQQQEYMQNREYHTLPYPVQSGTEFTGSTQSPIATYSPKLMEIAYLRTAEERAAALREIGFTLSEEFSDEKNLVAISPNGQPIVVFRGTQLDNPKDVNTDRKILMGRSDEDIQRVRKGQQLVRNVGTAYGRNDTMALGHSLGGFIAQRSNAPGGAITYNKLSIGNDTANPYGQQDYRTYGDFASHLRDRSAVPTIEFPGSNPYTDMRGNHTPAHFQKYMESQNQIGEGQSYLDGSRTISVYPTA